MNSIPFSEDKSPLVLLDLIHSARIKDVVKKDYISASKNDTLHDVQLEMKKNHISGVLVAEGKRLLGIITVANIMKAFELNQINDKVEKHMTKSVIPLEDEMPLSFAIEYFDKYSFNMFPVLNDKREIVGIITTREIIFYLLNSMNEEVARLEESVKKQQEMLDKVTDKQENNFELTKSKIIRYVTVTHDFKQAGKASTEIKNILKAMDVEKKIIRRVSVASYELEMNQVVHSVGGEMIYIITNEKVEIIAKDNGPGIENVEDALKEGFSTATEWIRSLGFGAGMGLPNSKRVSDHFVITSEKGKFTDVRCVIFLKPKGDDDESV